MCVYLHIYIYIYIYIMEYYSTNNAYVVCCKFHTFRTYNVKRY